MHYKNKDTRIKLLNSSNTPGLLPALQLGQQHMHGKYVTRMDADDIMPVNKLAHLVSELEEKGAGYVSTGYVRYFSSYPLGDGFLKYQNWLNKLTERQNNFSNIYKECVIPSPSWMMSIDDFNRIGGFTYHTYPEDYDLCFRMYKHGLKVASSHNEVHLWRDHKDRISRNDINYANQQFFALKAHYFLALDHNPKKQLTIWGAGKRAKTLVQHFLEKGVKPDWVCDNPKKIGHSIYGITLKHYETIQPQNSQVLVAVSDVVQPEIIKWLTNAQVEYYLFC